MCLGLFRVILDRFGFLVCFFSFSIFRFLLVNIFFRLVGWAYRGDQTPIS